MNTDTRMLFVRNKEMIDQNAPSIIRTSEYMVVVDSHIVGMLDFGPYHFTIWEFGLKKPGEERWLCLRVQEADNPERARTWQTATDSGFYHGGGIASEIVVLTSLFLRRRMRLGPIVGMDDHPQMLSSSALSTPHYLSKGRANLGELSDDFRLVERLIPSRHEPFILAVKLYNQALQLLDSNPELAYLNLVSAVEVIAQKHQIERPSLEELDPRLAAVVGAIPDDELRKKLEDSIWARERLISRKFCAFIESHVETSFWEDETRPEMGRIKSDYLPALLRKVYSQRSRTLHTGEPFFPGITSTNEELPMGLAMIVGERKWEREDFIPTVSFFERLTNHVLKSFLKRNQAS